MTNRKLNLSNQRRKTIKCECGVEIVFLPDLKTMGNAIDVHVSTHMEKMKAPKESAEIERLREALIAQILKIASQSEDKGSP